MFKFLPFQREDFARAAAHDGLVLSLDTGLGKTLAGVTWSLLKAGSNPIVHPGGRRELRPLKPCLLVAPGDLHHQAQQDLDELLGTGMVRFTALGSQDTFHALNAGRRTADGRAWLEPGFYITSYTQLGSNGLQKIPDVDSTQWTPRVLLQSLGLDEATLAGPFFEQRHEHWSGAYDHFKCRTALEARELTHALLDSRYKSMQAETDRIKDDEVRAERRQKNADAYQTLLHLVTAKLFPVYADLQENQKLFVLKEALRQWLAPCHENNGKIGEHELDAAGKIRGGVFFRTPEEPGPDVPTRKIKCAYSPTLADLCHDAFDVVCVDEGVRMKGGVETLVGLGILTMKPKHRMVLTATPIKNRLPDIWWLCWWATGGRLTAHARWPYSANPSEQQAFAETFMVSECNLSKAAQKAASKAGGSMLNSRQLARMLRNGDADVSKSDKKRYTKLRPEACNVHRLWKLLAPCVLRRRKSDVKGIVNKVRKVYEVPMGRFQSEVYTYHLEASYLDCNRKPSVTSQLQALRSAAADPTSDLLKAQFTGNAKPLIHRSPHLYTPKMACVMALIRDIVAAGEQVIVFAAFHSPLEKLSGLLREADVRHLVLHGDTPPARRGQMAAQFKRPRGHDGVPVMLAGADSMAEGHSFPKCSHVILLSYSWALDKLVQAINRVHRLNSAKDVTVHCVMTKGTIDRQLESLLEEKEDAAELVLDGKLTDAVDEEVNLAQLLRTAYAEFDPKSKTVDERELHREWPALRDSLRTAAANWHVGPNVLPCLQTGSPVQIQAGEKMSRGESEKVSQPTPAPVPVPPAHLLTCSPAPKPSFLRREAAVKPVQPELPWFLQSNRPDHQLVTA